MPQADIYFSADQSLPAEQVLAEIERAIRAFDSGAGACKGRAHPIAESHHSHVYLTLSMLPKPHRDDSYASELGAQLCDLLAGYSANDAALGVNIRFDLQHYTTRAPA